MKDSIIELTRKTDQLKAVDAELLHEQIAAVEPNATAISLTQESGVKTELVVHHVLPVDPDRILEVYRKHQPRLGQTLRQFMAKASEKEKLDMLVHLAVQQHGGMRIRTDGED